MKILSNLLVKAGVIVDQQVAVGTNSPFVGYTIDARGSNNFGTTSSEAYHYFSSSNVAGGSALTVQANNLSANSARSQLMLTDAVSSVLSRFGLGVYTASGQQYAYLDSASKLVLNNASGANVIIGGVTDDGYKLDVNGSVRSNINGYYSTNGTVTAPVIRFDGNNKVLVDPQGYGTVMNATASVAGQLSVNSYITSTGYHMVMGGSTAVDTPFISYAIGRPDAPYSLQPLSGIGGYFSGVGWYNGAGLTFYTSNGPDISGGAYLQESMRITPAGVVRIGNLAGTGTRIVVADSTGVLSASTLSSSLTSGSGTTNYVAKWTSDSVLGNSQIFDNGTNVGIGTGTPLAKLHIGNGSQSAINGASTKAQIMDGNNGGRAALLTLATSSASVVVEGQFESDASSADLRIIMGSTTNHPVILRTNNTERLRITSDGDILYRGTYNPLSAANRGTIMLNGSASNIIGFSNNSALRGYIFHTDSDFQFYNNTTGGRVGLYTEGTARLWIQANGRVGINTTTDAGFQFDVNGTARINNDLRVNSTAGFNTLFTQAIGGGGLAMVSTTDPTSSAQRLYSLGFGSVNYPAQARIEALSTEAWTATNRGSALRFNTTPNGSAGSLVRMFIENDGNVGIGTASPLYRFHAVTSDATIGAFRNSGAANGQLLVGNTAGDLTIRTLSTGDSYIFSDVGKYLDFGSNGTFRMRITSGGNFGIGITNPVYKVDALVNTNGFDGYNVYGAQGGVNEVIGYRSTQGNGIGLIMGTTGAQATSAIGGPNQSVIYSVGNQNLIFGTNSTLRMVLSPDGNLGLGMTPLAMSNYGVFNIKGRVVNQAGIIAFYDGQGDNFGAIQSDTNYGLLLANGQGKPIVIMTNSVARLSVNNTGGVTVSSLAGTGVRLVTADANGLLGVSGLASGVVTGSGTLNYLPKWTPDGATLGNSQIFDNGGGVGIGTTSPGQKLEIYDGALLINRPSLANDASHTMFRTQVGTDATLGQFYFMLTSRPSATGTNRYVEMYAGDNIGYRNITFPFANIGIGTTSPAVALHVFRSSGASTIIAEGGTTNSAYGRIEMRGRPSAAGQSSGYIVVASTEGGQSPVNIGAIDFAMSAATGNAHFMSFATHNGTSLGERMRIFANGRVFIGSSSADAGFQLDVNGTFRAQGSNFVGTFQGTDPAVSWKNASYEYYVQLLDTSNRFRIVDRTANVERISLLSSGNVGIGISNPAYLLEVYKNGLADIVANSAADGNSAIVSAFNSGGTSGNFAQLRAYGNTTGGTLFGSSTNKMISLYSNGDSMFTIGTISGTSLAFGTTNIERIRITSGGNVGIGTTSPSVKLHVVQSSGDIALFSRGDTGNALVQYTAFDTSSDIIHRFRLNNGSGNFFDLRYYAVNNYLGFDYGGTTRLAVASSGNVGVGTTTPAASARLDVTSTTQGFLPPRMTATQRAAITSPAVGLVVYQTDGNEGLWIYTNANGWKSLAIVV